MTALDWIESAGRTAATAFGVAAALYVALYHLSQLLMLAVAWLEIRRQAKGRHAWKARQVAEDRTLPGICLVIPAYNEEVSIVRTVSAALAVTYPRLEILVVNDGSTDATLETLIRRFDLRPLPEELPPELPCQPIKMVLESRRHPNLRVVDKRNGGKADSLNAGIGITRQPLVCAIDADVLLDRWALFHLARPYLDDPETVASSGMIRLTNGCREEGGRIVERRLPGPWLERMQVLEYIRAFSVGRLFFNRWNAHLIISGAFGLFRRSALLDVGGYQPFSIGEDMELVVRLHRHLRRRRRPYRMAFVADAVCYTEAPRAAGELGRQRTRWHHGLLTTLRLHGAGLLRPSFGLLGMLVVPYFVLFELLSPIFELGGWLMLLPAWLLGLVSAEVLLSFLAAAVVLGSAVSLAAIAIDGLELGHFVRAEDSARLALFAFLEHFGYHQLTLAWRLRAFPRFYRSIHLREGWRPPERQQLASDEAPP